MDSSFQFGKPEPRYLGCYASRGRSETGVQVPVQLKPAVGCRGLLEGQPAGNVFTMSKADILKELPALQPEDRREIFDRLCDLEERDLLAGHVPTAAEKALLDAEMEDYRKNPDNGSSWAEVEARLRNPSNQ